MLLTPDTEPKGQISKGEIETFLDFPEVTGRRKYINAHGQS